MHFLSGVAHVGVRLGVSRCGRSPIWRAASRPSGCSRLRSMITSKRPGPRSRIGCDGGSAEASRSFSLRIRRMTEACSMAKPYGPSGISGPIFCAAIAASSATMPRLQALDRVSSLAFASWRFETSLAFWPARDRHVLDPATRRLQAAGKVGVVLDGRVELAVRLGMSLQDRLDVLEVFLHRLQKRQCDHRAIEHERIERLHSGLFFRRTAGWRHAVGHGPRHSTSVNGDTAVGRGILLSAARKTS